MNPGIGDLLNDWLVEIDSRWKHINAISWRDDGGFGEAISETGFLQHPLSENFEELVWIQNDYAYNPCYFERIYFSDPEFFEKLKDAMDKMETTFQQSPDRNLGHKSFGAGLASWKR